MITAGQCHIRPVEKGDYSELERIYVKHEGEKIPEGYFFEFCTAIRDPSVFYFVAECNSGIVGGGGISNYTPLYQAMLTFGLVETEYCGQGIGTALLVFRLLYIEADESGCSVSLMATENTVDFFSRLQFHWLREEANESGNRFFTGTHTLYGRDKPVFREILKNAGVTLAPSINLTL